MTMKNNYLHNTEITTINGLIVRIRIPDCSGPHPVIIMLHGWTGNEDSMWIFSSRLPGETLLVSPRGIFEYGSDGYSWLEDLNSEWPSLERFQPAVEGLFPVFDEINDYGGDKTKISILGFSQGAALGYTLGLLKPGTIRSIAGLSGFLPENYELFVDDQPLAGKRIFIAHGTRDQYVRVEKARESVNLLQKAGADVTYCEDDVGHKLSIYCFRSLRNFYKMESIK